MDTHTTNIADLPIDHIPQNTEIPENIPPQINRMDQEVYESPYKSNLSSECGDKNPNR